MAFVALHCECGHRCVALAAAFPRVLRCCVCGRVRAMPSPVGSRMIGGDWDDTDEAVPLTEAEAHKRPTAA
jgi:hypothetical protein